jgi:hypothetical protein
MRPNKTRAFIAAVALTFSIAGCSSSGPEIDDPDDTSPYRLRTSPENVIYNLTVAYAGMDVDGYIDCLADSFVFHLNPADINDPDNPLPPQWSRDVEHTIHHNMFADDSDVVSVSLTLTTTHVDSMPGPAPGSDDDRWLYREAVDLRVTVTDVPENTTYHAAAPVEFLFRIDQNEVGPHGEQLWEIIEWWDVPYQQRPGDLVESTSWGSIKALWR